MSSQKQPRVVGIYQVGEIIGRGACGKVYKGLNTKTGEHVAIKQVALRNIKEEHKSAILMEINLLKKLDHPNIVKYIDSVYTDFYLNIILEYIECGSLANSLKKFGRFNEPVVTIYIKHVLEGLKFLHTQGVIHRDIKGANILITKTGLVKVADFGVATKLSETEKSHSFAGTPYWMAPEVIGMSGNVTTACDIWSLACTVIELITGKPPYYDLNPMTAMLRIVQEDMPPIPDKASDELKDFLKFCLQKEPFLRADAKGLLEHPWIRKCEKNEKAMQKIMTLRINDKPPKKAGKDGEEEQVSVEAQRIRKQLELPG